MSNYIAIRTYKLKPDIDRTDFEKAFENIKSTLDLQKVVLLKGYQGDINVSRGDVDYVSLHIFESVEACIEFWEPAFAAMNEGKNESDILSHYPEELRPFLQIVGKAHYGEIAESTIHGYTVVHGTV